MQRYNVQISRIAESDIRKVFEYISKDSKPAAAKWVREIAWQIDTLEKFPLRCGIIPEAQELGDQYRHLIYGNYRTIFRVEGLNVIILRVIHGARLLDQQSFVT
ncbi:MAG: type II toxin-antitoxin system RelE/ParE family toxin [Candidatus Humimicrobiaceae bacterium]